MHTFQLTTSLCYGPDSLSALATLADKRVLVVTDAYMSSSPLMDKVRAALGGAEVVVFDRVTPNPDTDVVTEGLRCFLACKPHAIVALGGGSPIDTAKTVRKLALEQGHGLDGGFIVIPTTSGSGSEVTSFAVVTSSHDHVKHPLTSPDMLPDVAILDPEAVRSAPPRLTADAGMDAASHAIEAYVAQCANDFSDALAEKALRTIFIHLPRAFANGEDIDAREHQHNAATMAGIAFENAGLGIVHGLSHAIGSSFPVAHGRLNGILLPHVIAFNAGELGYRPRDLTPVARRYAELASVAGIKAASERNLVLGLITQVKKLRASLELPSTMTQAGIDPAAFAAAIPALAETAAHDFCTSGNPVEPTIENLADILKKIV